MTRRAYISCSIEAALAAKNHGFRFVSDMGTNLIYDGKWRTEDCLHGEYGGETFYLHPDSMWLLEPMEGDVIYHDDFGYGTVYGFVDGEPFTVGGDCQEYFLTGGKIIQRNGKPFPEMQWEDVE